MLPAALHFCVTQQVIGNHSQHKNTREMLDDTLCAIRLSSLLKDWGADLTSCCPFLLNFATFYFPISNFKIMPFDYYQTYAKNEDTCLFTKDWTSQIYFSYIYYISTVSATRAQTVVAFLLIMGVHQKAILCSYKREIHVSRNSEIFINFGWYLSSVRWKRIWLLFRKKLFALVGTLQLNVQILSYVLKKQNWSSAVLP